MDLHGAWAVVSGGASGLGRAAVEALVARGARVRVLDLQKQSGFADPAVESREVDVGDAGAVEAAIADIPGPLRMAVSAAGIAPSAKLVGRDAGHDPGLFDRVLRVNLIGTFNVMRAAAVRMSSEAMFADGSRGVIVNTASIAAEDGQIAQCAYSASKGGVASMTLPAARELARHGVRVVAIAPGVFATPMMAAMPDHVRDGLNAAAVFPKRMGEPEEYGALVLHIADNAYLNGTIIRLDAGLRMGA